MNNPQLVVMAAGIGSRYGGLKQVDPVGPSGEMVIDYSIYDALRAGFTKVVFIIRRDIEAEFREKVGKTIEERVDTAYVFQELDRLPPGFEVPQQRRKPWGTGHAVLCARGEADQPFGVINADDFYGCTSFMALADFLRQAQDTDDEYRYCMIGFSLWNTLSDHGHVARGICSETDDGYLAHIVERTKIQKFGEKVKFTRDGETWKELPRDAVVSMNTWGFTQSIFNELETGFRTFLENRINEPKAEFFLPSVVNRLIESGRARVEVCPTDEAWFGMTYRQDKSRTEQEILQLIENGTYPARLWEEHRG